MCKGTILQKNVFLFSFVLISVLIGCTKEQDTNQGPVPPPPLVETATGIVVFIENNDAIGSVDIHVYNPDLSLKWKKTNIGTGVIATPVVNNGLIYVAAAHFEFIGSSYISHNNFYALDINTGVEKWSLLQTQQGITGMQARNDTIFVSGGKGFANMLQAYNANTGTLLWEKITGDQYSPFNPHLEGNVLYYGTSKSNTVSYLAALDIHTRQKIWETPLSINITTGHPSKFAILDELIFVTNGLKQLMAINKNTGTLVWTKSASHPVVENNMLYVTDNEGMKALTPISGMEIWRYTKTGNSPFYVSGAPFLLNGNVYLSGADDGGSFLLSVKGFTGALNWKKYTNMPGYDKAIVVGKEIYVQQEPGTLSSKLIIFSAETGAPKDSISPGRIDGPYGIITDKGKFRFNLKEVF